LWLLSLCVVFLSINNVRLAQWRAKWPTADNVSRVTITLHTLVTSHFFYLSLQTSSEYFRFLVNTEQRTGNCNVSSSGIDPLWMFRIQNSSSRSTFKDHLQKLHVIICRWAPKIIIVGIILDRDPSTVLNHSVNLWLGLKLCRIAKWMSLSAKYMHTVYCCLLSTLHV